MSSWGQNPIATPEFAKLRDGEGIWGFSCHFGDKVMLLEIPVQPHPQDSCIAWQNEKFFFQPLDGDRGELPRGAAFKGGERVALGMG